MTLFLPLVICLGGLTVFWTTEESTRSKLILSGLFGVSAAFEFVPALYMHWLPPVLLQIALAIGLLIYFQAK